MFAELHAQRISKDWRKHIKLSRPKIGLVSRMFCNISWFFQYNDHLLIAEQFFQLELVENRYIQVLSFC